jgi:prepilin-type N-terminal cleavage/methylation domain-containing protein/prepilin-type processing-associated H-X9-DG protein
MRRKGFTLIELLVVIAIIAILAAILFPVFARARENARKSTCQSNLKQLSLGVLQYLQDYDEHFPLWDRNQAANLHPLAPPKAVYAYVKNNGVYVCPSGVDAPKIAGLPDGWDQYGWGTPLYDFPGPASMGYSWNREIFQECCNEMGRTSLKLASMTKPAETVLVGDGAHMYGGEGTDVFANACCASPSMGWQDGSLNGVDSGTGQATPESASRHSGGSNLGFADGHVKWKNDKELLATINTIKQWNQ